MNDDHRPDPDALLAQVQREESQEKKGRLYILLGMCPGVGKTYAMLLLARQRQADGLKVLVGIVETHGRRKPPRCWRIWRFCRGKRSNTAATRWRNSISTPRSSAGRICCWWMNSPTPTRPAAAI